MTVSSTKSSETFACNGVTTLFVAPFRVLEATSVQGFLITIATGESAPLVNGTDFTVSGVGDENTNITTAVAYSSAYTLHVKRVTPRLQETDYRDNDPFPAESHEAGLDRLTHIVQEDAEVLSRAMIWPDGETAPVLPPKADRADKLWANDSNGDLVFVVPVSGSVGSFALDLASNASATKGAGMVGYAGTGFSYAAGTVGERLQRQKNPSDYGAAGDGSTNDATAMQAAVSAGGVLDGLGLTYKCNSPLTGIPSGTTLRNMTLDFSSVATVSAHYLEATGTKGAAVALTVNLAAGSVAVSVGSTASFAAEQWAWLQSADVWATIDGSVFGQFVKIKSVDSSGTMTLYAGPIVPFNTAAAASISPVTPVERVKFENVKVIGSGANSQIGLYVTYGLDCIVDRSCTFTDCDNAGVSFWRGVNCRAAPTVLRARAAGLAYGIGLYGGCYGCAVDGGYGEDVRHYVTVGDNDGINIDCRATNNVVAFARSAGIDSHVSSFNFVAAGNQITLAAGAGAEGITLQGLNSQAIGNTIRGVTGIGIYMQPLVTASFKTKVVARGNSVQLADNVAGTQIGIYFQNNSGNGTDWESGDMDGNVVYGGAGSTGSIHFYILANRGTMKNITVRGNISADVALSQALYIRALAASTAIENVTVSGNHFKTSGNRAIYVIAEGAGSTVDDVIIHGNTIEGGSTANIGIVGNAGVVTNVIEDNSIFSGGADLYAVTGTTNGLKLKSAKHVPPITISAGTGATEPDTDTYIFDNAGTVTFTLPTAATYPGREFMLRTIQAQAVNSASSNVVPRTSATAGTSILPATDGAWAILKSDGTNWQTVAGS